MAKMNDSAIRDIPEQVKNRVLDWACDLEAADMTGVGQSFPKDEKEAAQTVAFIIRNNSIDQLDSSGDNSKSQ